MKQLVFILAFFLPLFLHSAEVDSVKALIIAKNYAYEVFAYQRGQTIESMNPRIQHVVRGDSNKPLLYFVNLEPTGFLIISGDDRCYPILAYNENDTWSNEKWEILYPGSLFFLDEYTKGVQAVINSNHMAGDGINDLWEKLLDSSKLIPENVRSETSLERMRNLRWSQCWPYNDSCPTNNFNDPQGCSNNKVPAGCVAVAISQIMRYWNWPPYGNGSKTYNDPGNTIVNKYCDLSDPSYGSQAANFGITAYNWHNMDNYIYIENPDAAQIIRHAGVAVEMDYTYCVSNSSASKAKNAFEDYFRYSSSIDLKWKAGVLNWDTWESMMSTEINQGRPIYYGGSSVDWPWGDGIDGHAFVCYAYKENDSYLLFKFNWGWGYIDDTWYTVRNVAGNHNYNTAQRMIINIFPDGSNINPCNSPIQHIANVGPEYEKTFTGGGLGMWHTSTLSPCGYNCIGVEQVYSFVAPLTGTYSIQVTSADGWVNYMWKEGDCSLSGWNCIENIGYPGTYGEMEWVAGTAYHVLLDDTDNIPGKHMFHINPPILPIETILYNGTVNPTSGTNLDTYNFSVYYQGSSAPVTNSIKVVVNGVQHTMTPNGSNWADGVEFTKSLSGFSPGTYAYHFIGSAGGHNLRLPVSGYYYFNVSQSAVGWDANVTSLTANKYYFSGSTNIVSYGTVRNDSYAGNTYYNLPVKFEMFNPSGDKIHESTDNISSLAPGQSFNIQTPSINIPSSAPNGIYQVLFTVFPILDNNPGNNSRTVNIIKGSSASAEHFHIHNNDWFVNMTTNSTYPFGGNTFTFKGILSNGKAWIRDQNNNNVQIPLYDFEEFDGGNIVVIFAFHASTHDAYFHFGLKNPSLISYENVNISAFPGDQVEFIAHTNAPNNFNLGSEFYSDPHNIQSWFQSSHTVLYNSNRSIKRYFSIPTSASPGNRVFYFLQGFNSTNQYIMSRLQINVLQPPPQITSLSSYSFASGQLITITGNNFGNTTGQVKFNDLNGVISSWSNNSITCTVPQGVQSGILTVIRGSTSSNGIAYEALFNVNLSANPVEGGSVIGAGIYNHNASVVAIATANDYWIFANWTENGNVVSTDEVYFFTITEDRDLVANFVECDVPFYCVNYFSTCLGDPPLYLDALCIGELGYENIEIEFSGPGVFYDGINYFFDSSFGLGTYLITACYNDLTTGCTVCNSFPMEVKPIPVVNCPDDYEVDIDTPSFLLTGGTPSGGEYHINGIYYGDITYFNPSEHGAGSHIIAYHYPCFECVTIPVFPPPPPVCTNSCEFIITVIPNPEIEVLPSIIDFGEVPINDCHTLSYQLTGTGLNDNIIITTPPHFQVSTNETNGFENMISVPHTNGIVDQTIYVKFCPDEVGGHSGEIENVSVGAETKLVTVLGVGISYCFATCVDYYSTCLGYPPLNLQDLCFNREGHGHINGFYSGNGVFYDGTDFFFDSSIGIGIYPITYCYTDPISGCSHCADFIMEILPIPEVDCPSDMEITIDTPGFILAGGSPSGGEFIGQGVHYFYGGWPVVKVYTFNPVLAGIGTHEITYLYPETLINIPSIPPAPPQCQNNCSFFITINGASVPGIPPTVILENIIVPTGQHDCFNATGNITIAGNGKTFEIHSGAEATFIAGNNILFKSGFHAQHGSTAHAYITTTNEYCNDNGISTILCIENQNIQNGNNECFEAKQIVMLGGNGGSFDVENGGQAKLVAGNKIQLLPGVHLHQGSEVHGYISTNGYYCDDPTLTLENITILANQSDCFEALETITVGGNGSSFTVKPGGEARIVAVHNIVFKDGTLVEPNGYLHAWISTNGIMCNQTNSLLVVEDESGIPEQINFSIDDKSRMFKVYPNPTTGTFTLELLHTDDAPIISVSIFSMIGELLLQTELPSQNLYEFNLSNHPKGIYIIRVIAGDEMGVEKLIKH